MSLDIETEQKLSDVKDSMVPFVLFYTPGIYSITINPAGQHYNDVKRLLNFKNHWRRELVTAMTTDETIDYSVYVELSEPREFGCKKSQGPRLHMHGIIALTTMAKCRQFLLSTLPALATDAYIEVDRVASCADLARWLQYCTKQQEIMGDVIITNDKHVWRDANIYLAT